MAKSNGQAALSRREFVGGCASCALAAVVVGYPATAEAATKIAVTATRKCGTCDFWGGSRQVSSDRKWVLASGTGTCNNPQSPAYRKKTKPTQGAPVWKKWTALG